MTGKFPLFWPVLAQVVLTYVVLLIMGARRSRSLAEHRQGLDDPDVRLGKNKWNDSAHQASRNYNNLLENPVLFYVAAAFATLTGQATPLIVGLAWAYVAARVAHTVVHLGSNVINVRGTIFLVAAALLAVMWLTLAWRIAAQ